MFLDLVSLPCLDGLVWAQFGKNVPWPHAWLSNATVDTGHHFSRHSAPSFLRTRECPCANCYVALCWPGTPDCDQNGERCSSRKETCQGLGFVQKLAALRKHGVEILCSCSDWVGCVGQCRFPVFDRLARSSGRWPRRLGNRTGVERCQLPSEASQEIWSGTVWQQNLFGIWNASTASKAQQREPWPLPAPA